MISIALLIVAGAFNSIMDSISFWYESTFFAKYPSLRQFCDPSVSWKNKYKLGNINLGAKFFLSTTSLVFLTDLWHLSKFLMLVSISFSIVFYCPIINLFVDTLIFYLTFTTSFTLTNKILKI